MKNPEESRHEEDSCSPENVGWDSLTDLAGQMRNSGDPNIDEKNSGCRIG